MQSSKSLLCSFFTLSSCSTVLHHMARCNCGRRRRYNSLHYSQNTAHFPLVLLLIVSSLGLRASKERPSYGNTNTMEDDRPALPPELPYICKIYLPKQTLWIWQVNTNISMQNVFLTKSSHLSPKYSFKVVQWWWKWFLLSLSDCIEWY